MAKHKNRKLGSILRSARTKLALVIIVLLLLGFGAWAVADDSEVSQDPPPTESAIDSDTPNPGSPDLSPATPQERQETQDYKKSLTQNQGGSSATTSEGKKVVYPVITGASHEEVNAYVSGIVEDGGTCTATATKGSQTITGTSTGFANVSYTSCPPISLSLPAGKWSVVLNYSSATSEGKSQVFEVD